MVIRLLQMSLVANYGQDKAAEEISNAARDR